jgi:5-methylcytosine-specific restriction endonuclease McrA
MRYRATATISWDFDTQLSHNEAQELANRHLGEFPNQDGINDLRLVVRLDKLKEKVEKVKLGEFPIEDVIPFISKEDSKREYEYEGVKHSVKMNSHRYFIFRECMNCVACGLLGTRMFLECHPADKSPHFNLYGEEEGKLILMTKDHIHAKSFGGEDRHSNYQTMCLVCNNLKGHSNLTLDGVRELRNVYNENKNKVTKKKLHLLIEETRAKLEQPWPSAKLTGTQRRKWLAKMKATADAVMTACDINLYSGQDAEIYGKSVYDAVDNSHKHVGCIKKGTCLEPLVATKEKVMCKLFEHDVVVLHHSLVKAKE